MLWISIMQLYNTPNIHKSCSTKLYSYSSNRHLLKRRAMVNYKKTKSKIKNWIKTVID